MDILFPKSANYTEPEKRIGHSAGQRICGDGDQVCMIPGQGSPAGEDPRQGRAEWADRTEGRPWRWPAAPWAEG